VRLRPWSDFSPDSEPARWYTSDDLAGARANAGAMRQG
jgi:hypothetical protein